MKLRIRENAIRLRLKRSDVEQIVSGRSIVEETHFPDSVLTYRLEVSDDGRHSASFDKGNLTKGANLYRPTFIDGYVNK